MEFREIQSKIEKFGSDHPTYWGCALAGEAGEVANILKKIERDGFSRELAMKLSEELADVFIYLSLTAEQFNIDLMTEILLKIDVVKERRKQESNKT